MTASTVDTGKEFIALNKIVKLVREQVNPDMAISQLAIFLEVVINGDITQAELSKKLNMLGGTLSRNMRQLTKYAVQGGNQDVLKGYDLFTVEPDIYERRRNLVKLSKHGRSLAEAISNILMGNR